MSRAKLRWEIDRGSWQMVLPAVYATFTGELSTLQRVIAACLYAGQPAQVTGSAALEVYGLHEIPPDDTVHLLIPHGRQVVPVSWVRPQRTRRLDPAARSVGGLAVASLARAVLDAARHCASEAPVRRLLIEAVEQRHCTVAALRAELAAGPRQYSAGLRRLIVELAGRDARTPAALVRDRLARSPILPTVVWDPVLHTADGQPLQAPDAWIAEVDLGIELEPIGRHVTLDGWAHALQRHAELARHGAVVLRFTTDQLRGDPGDIQRFVEEVYLDRLRRSIRGTLTVRARGMWR